MPRKILIVVADDDDAMRHMLAATLRRDGFDVDECDSGSALIERLNRARATSTPPDLVVSDVQMPGATGLDALHWLGHGLRGVPVILITAFGDRRTHARARSLGAAIVIDKPFDLDELRASVAQVLQRGPGAGAGAEPEQH